jgi:hypothetical protein
MQAAGLSLAAFGVLAVLVASHPVGSTATTAPDQSTTTDPTGGTSTGPADPGVQIPSLGGSDSFGSGGGFGTVTPRVRIGSGTPHLRSGGS